MWIFYLSSNFRPVRIFLHQSLHLNKKCLYCKYSCSGTTDLRKHVDRVHLKLRKNKCDHCKASFLSNHDLQNHLKKVHLTDKEVHVCNSCGSAVSSAKGLKTHFKRAHSKIKQCYKCKIHFKSQIDLKNHMNTAHRPM